MLPAISQPLSDLRFNAESNISNDFEISAIIQNQEGDLQIFCQLMDKGHTRKPGVIRTIAP